MGAAPTREAESIVYRRKSFRKKNSSPAIKEPRGSAVGGTANDSIAPNVGSSFLFITCMVQLRPLCQRILLAVSVQPEYPSDRR